MATHNKRHVEFDGRSVDELIGTVTEHRRPAGSCSHQNHPGFFLSDKRPNSPYRSRHEGGEWITYYCEPHADVLAAWRKRMGPIYGDSFSMGSFEAIRWTDGRTVLIATSRSHIGSLWLTIEPAA